MNGVHWPACAKVVSPAMEKQMSDEDLTEIPGDHEDITCYEDPER